MRAAVPSIDGTHDPAVRSWVESANVDSCDFPIQNLPFGRFRMGGQGDWRIGVAIGDQVLDLRRAGLVDHADMNRLIALPGVDRRALRRAIHAGLAETSRQHAHWRDALTPISDVELGVPCHIGDYTDFYVGIHHATAVGRLFRPDHPLLPNYAWVPIGYHGRASTIQPSGREVRRPLGQIRIAPDAPPVLAPTQRLDHELELGIVIGRGNPIGESIPIEHAEDHVFGLTLFNDWSARDIQAWEYQPLGPFLSKNFASTISPWIVTLDALAPFRRPFVRPPGQPDPLPYLDSAANRAAGAFGIALEVSLQTRAMREAGMAAQCISRSDFADAACWTVAQLVAHHTVNGCALASGDLLGTGTLSGAQPGQAGSLLELTHGGTLPLALVDGETRSFLEDGDTIGLHAGCASAGWRRIGFGPCTATVLPARAARNLIE